MSAPTRRGPGAAPPEPSPSTDLGAADADHATPAPAPEVSQRGAVGRLLADPERYAVDLVAEVVARER